MRMRLLASSVVVDLGETGMECVWFDQVSGGPDAWVAKP